MILASQSPRRLELIASLGITPQVIPADIDESRKPNETPLALVKRLAQEKAIAVCRHLMDDTQAVEKNNEIVIAADTIVWPKTKQSLESRKTLKMPNVCFESFPARHTLFLPV